MQKINLKKYPESKKTTYTVYLYEDIIEQLRAISDDTGITVQNLFRHSLNETIDKFKSEQ